MNGQGQDEAVPQGPFPARVIPAAFPSGKTGHISGAMDVNMDRQREHGMDLDKRRPQAPRVEAGITGT